MEDDKINRHQLRGWSCFNKQLMASCEIFKLYYLIRDGSARLKAGM
jgi:hypothetical protein